MENTDVIVFSNLLQASPTTLGEYDTVKAKASSFAHSNASGEIRQCQDLNEVGMLAAASAKRSLSMFAA
ncbi:hypothetical protein ACSFBX_10080 [Variovorax sp. RB2P76]|uniref:hypothetical protein n=1 Tax=Variovorax sp. RB2P76 TaxID=3443736 RepID=UPI003F46F715